MPNIKELRENKAKFAAEIRKLADLANEPGKDGKGLRGHTAEELARWTAVNADYDSTKAAVEREERALSTESDSTLPNASPAAPGRDNFDASDEQRGRAPVVNTERDFSRSLQHWALMRAGKQDLIRTEHREAAARHKFEIGSKEVSLPLDRDTTRFAAWQHLYRTRRPDIAADVVQERALSTQVGALGGFTIAPYFNANIESALLYYGPMLQVTTPLRTETAADFPMPTDNETTKSGSYIGENTAVTTTEGVTVNLVIFHAYKATTNAILVPFELLRDTALNLPSYLSGKLGERLGRFMNTELTLGGGSTGVGAVANTNTKTKGIVTAATTFAAAGASAITFDDVLGLEHSVDLAYRNMPGNGYMCNDAITLALRKLKASGTGAYLWTDGTTAGQPDRLNGRSLYPNNDMVGSFSSGYKTLIFGHLPHYYHRMVGEIRLAQTSERYWEFDQFAFCAYAYFDGNIVDAGTHPIKVLTH